MICLALAHTMTLETKPCWFPICFQAQVLPTQWEILKLVSKSCSQSETTCWNTVLKLRVFCLGNQVLSRQKTKVSSGAQMTLGTLHFLGRQGWDCVSPGMHSELSFVLWRHWLLCQSLPPPWPKLLKRVFKSYTLMQSSTITTELDD